MNYYERHIGDYLKDTAHLSLLEHGVYTRLLDVYYTREGGIPNAEAARLIGARTKDERAALAAVLAEFFVESDGLHVQQRADREISAYREGDEDRDAKRENAAERQRRTRERRKALFAELKQRGIVHEWNTPIHALEASLSRATKTNGSQPVTTPVTRDATATHTQSHTQSQITSSEPSGSAAKAAAVEPVDVIFAVGLPLLTSTGIPEKQARSFLGMARQQSGDEALVAAIDRCAHERPLEPIAFIRAHLAPTKARLSKQSAIETRNADAVRDFAAEQGALHAQ